MSNTVFIGAKEYFPGIGKIGFEGRDSDNPLAFKVYDANKQVAGKSMAEHLRFAVAYWHSFCGSGWVRSDHSHKATPATIIGTHSHWPMLRLRASRPRKLSGSRKYSATKRSRP